MSQQQPNNQISGEEMRAQRLSRFDSRRAEERGGCTMRMEDDRPDPPEDVDSPSGNSSDSESIRYSEDDTFDSSYESEMYELSSEASSLEEPPDLEAPTSHSTMTTTTTSESDHIVVDGDDDTPTASTRTANAHNGTLDDHTGRGQHEETAREGDDNDFALLRTLRRHFESPSAMRWHDDNDHSTITRIFNYLTESHSHPRHVQEEDTEEHEEEVDDEQGIVEEERDEVEEQQQNNQNVQTTTYQCCVCFEEIDTSDSNEPVLGCSGTSITHYFCRDCGLDYLVGSMGIGEVFETTQVPQRFYNRNGHDPNAEDTQQEQNNRVIRTGVSNPGELPCPGFVAGDCDCSSLSFQTILGMIGNDENAFRAYNRSIQNVGLANNNSDNGNNNENDSTRTSGIRRYSVPQIYNRVAEALSEGFKMRCPNCNQEGMKNNECMHMKCPRCNESWCYCCGRYRAQSGEPHERCRGCDSTNIYLQNQDGWQSFAIGTESSKEGALYEFHRQRQAYIVRHTKDETHPDDWDSFVRAYPNFLMDTPTDGRHITWSELDNAEPPVFGNSTVDDLLWKIDSINPVALSAQPSAPPANVDVEAQQRPQPPQEQQTGEPERLVDFFSILRSCEGGTWLFAASLSVILSVVKGASSNESSSLIAISGILSTFVAYTALQYILRWWVDFFARPRNWNHPARRYLYQEVYFIGTDDHPIPILSSLGLEGDTSSQFIRRMVASVTFGSLFISLSNELGSTNVLHCIGVTFVTFSVLYSVTKFTVGNLSYPPTPGEDASDYQKFCKIIRFQICILAVGCGLTSERYGGLPIVRMIGVILVCAGTGALLASLLPRCRRICIDDTIPFWEALGGNTVAASYLFWLGITIPVAMIWIDSSMASIIAQIIFYSCMTLLVFVCCCTGMCS